MRTLTLITRNISKIFSLFPASGFLLKILYAARKPVQVLFLLLLLSHLPPVAIVAPGYIYPSRYADINVTSGRRQTCQFKKITSSQRLTDVVFSHRPSVKATSARWGSASPGIRRTICDALAVTGLGFCEKNQTGGGSLPPFPPLLIARIFIHAWDVAYGYRASD